MDKPKQERKVIHLEIGGSHYYYGSIASLFDEFSEAELGFSIYKVKNNIGKLGIMQNDKCIIRLGVLKSKAGNRGIKSSSDGN